MRDVVESAKLNFQLRMNQEHDTTFMVFILSRNSTIRYGRVVPVSLSFFKISFDTPCYT